MWIPVTLAAAAFQTGRTALQHRLRSLLSVSGAGFVRYVWGAPLSLAAVGIALAFGVDFPTIEPRFLPVIAAGGIAQIVATIYLIKAFDARDYAIGTVYAKTEVIQIAVLSTVLLGEPLQLGGWVGAVICLVGVALLANRGRRLSWESLRDRAALYGLIAGGLFGLASIGIRGATHALHDSPVVMRAIVTLAVMNTIQTFLHGGYLMARDPKQIRLGFEHWRSSSIVGILSVCGSAGWAIALAMENAAKVRTLGQVEILFTFAVSIWFLHERHQRAEYWASALVIAGVITVIAAG